MHGRGRFDPEQPVQVLVNGEWRRGFAYLRQKLDDGWWHSMRPHWPLTSTRQLFVRYPDQASLPERWRQFATRDPCSAPAGRGR